MPRFPIPSSLSSKNGLSDSVGQITNELLSFLEYLQLPSRTEYWNALQQAGIDAVGAAKSLHQLSYLTFRPLLLLLWLIVQKCSIGAKFLFRHLFQGLYKSSIKGLEQLKWCGTHLLKWQYSLTRRQLVVEAGVVAVVLLLLVLRRYIQKQGYVQRVTRWYRIKQRRVMKLYRSTVDRISRTSLFLAMLLPHALFAGVCLTIKLLFSTSVTWLARDTYVIFILSTLYPWIWTVALLFQYRHPTAITDGNADVDSSDVDVDANANPNANGNSTINNNINIINNNKTPTKQRTPFKERSSSSTPSKSKTPSMFSRTAPKTPKTPAARSSTNKQQQQQQPPKTPVQRFLAATRGNINGSSSSNSNSNNNYSMEQEANYWMQYWVVYCLFSGFGALISMIPIFGRLASKSIWLQHASFELQLLFYLWIYGLGSVLTSTASSDADLERTYLVRPLPFLMKRLSPLLQKLYKATSEQIVTPALWQMICSKVKSFLSVAVMVRILSESTQDYLLAALSNAHPFVVPAISLLLPSFMTQYGVLYVKTIVPSAKATTAIPTSLNQRMVTLQYWVVHVLCAFTVHWWSDLLWWIPFSTHAIFLLWCHLQIKSTADNRTTTTPNHQQEYYYYYTMLERELQAFGLLPRGTATEILGVDKTVTAIVLRRLAKSLPSASSDDDNNNNHHDNDDGNSDNAATKVPAAALPDKKTVAQKAIAPVGMANNKSGIAIENARTEKENATSNDSDSSSSSSTKLRRSTRTRKVRLH